MATLNHSNPRGRRDRVTASAIAAKTAATTALALPMNSGDMVPEATAKRVTGTVREKASTPSIPQANPLFGADSSSDFWTVALLFIFMSNSSSLRIERELEDWIASAAPGARLPSTRELTARFTASPVTVQSALRALAARGLIETRPGVGTFARPTRTSAAHDFSWQTGALGAAKSPLVDLPSALRETRSDTIPLHSGYPDRSLLPERLLRAALVRSARSDAAVKLSDPAGLASLREWFASELSAQMPAQLAAPTMQDVIVLPGSQLGLGSLFRSIVGPGGTLLVESPTYWGAISAARQVGVTLVPIPVTSEGPDLDVLSQAFRDTGARAFYAQPNYANPTGLQWSPDVSLRVLEIVRRHRAFVIDDDWAHDFGITTASTPLALQDDRGHVVYLRSLTKSISPALRVAAVTARGPLRRRLLADLQAQSMYVSGLLQAAAFDVVSQPGWQTHLRALRRELRVRRGLLVNALANHAPEVRVTAVPPGGLNLWVQLPDSTNLERLVVDAEAKGLGLASGNEWFPSEPSGKYLRLNYAGPNPGSFEQAAVLLQESLDMQL